MRYHHLLVSLSLFLFVGLSLAFLSPFPIHGQEPSATPSISDETIKENIRERLEEAVKGTETEGKSSNATTAKRAWAGSLTDITNHTLTLTVKSESKQAEVSDDTVIVDENRQTIDIDNLEIGTFVVAMGYLTPEGVLDARRVVESAPPSPLTLAAYFVTIESIDDDTLTVKNISDDQTWELELDDAILITQSVDGENAEIKLADLKETDRIIVIGSQNTETPTTLDTTNIHLVSPRTIPAVDTKESTSSADESAE